MNTFSLTAKSANYAAKVIRLPKPYKHPNADKLQCVDINGDIVITGLDAKEGDLYVYFPLNCKINKQFLADTNSFSDSSLNTDKTKKGFFEESGRVKPTRLRSMPSMGYIVPIKLLLDWAKASGLINSIADIPEQGFDTINGVLICEKYIPYVKMSNTSSLKRGDKNKERKKFDKLIQGQFRFHVDTGKLSNNIHRVYPDNIINISYKLHGTSGVYANILCKRKLPWYEKILKILGIKIQDQEYDYVYSSRSVIKNTDLNDKTGYYNKDIWSDAYLLLKDKIEKGYTLYVEIVGYIPNSESFIQKGYDYGQDKGTYQIYVYRITYTNPDGEVFELNTKQYESYCTKYALNTVPRLWHGKASDYLEFSYTDPHNYLQDLESWRKQLVNKITNSYLEKDCHMCKNTVPNEGIVLRVDDRPEFEAYKLKSFRFFEMESKELDNNTIDIETVESCQSITQE